MIYVAYNSRRVVAQFGDESDRQKYVLSPFEV